MNYPPALQHIGKFLIWKLFFVSFTLNFFCHSRVSYAVPIPPEIRYQYLEVLNRAKNLGIEPIQIPAPGDAWESADIDPLSLDFLQTLIRFEAGLRNDSVRTHTESGPPDRTKCLFDFCDRCRDKHQPRGEIPSLKWYDFLDRFENDRADRIEMIIGAIELGAVVVTIPTSIILCFLNLPVYPQVPVCLASTVPLGMIVSHALIRSALVLAEKSHKIHLEKTLYLETKKAKETEREVLLGSLLEQYGPIFPALKEALKALEELIRLRVQDIALPGIAVITIP